MKKAPKRFIAKVGQGEKLIKKYEIKPRSKDPSAPPIATSRKSKAPMKKLNVLR